MAAAGRKLKAVFLGHVDVGKSSLFRRYLNGDFEDTTNTVGAALGLVEMYPKEDCPGTYTKGDVVQVGDGVPPPPHGGRPSRQDAVRVQIWDTAGQEQYSSLLPMYFRNADVCICVIDGTDAACDRIPGILDAIEEENGSHMPVIALWRNKSDLPCESARAREFVNQAFLHDDFAPVDCRAVVSAKTNDGVATAFEECLSMAIRRRAEMESIDRDTSFRQLEPPPTVQDGGAACAC
mmetsp:Transcript_29240/g.76601  ORF Transcript_29240/g.76601 Transcript_29240/m.76601 type:complete len:236 (-) Transcript_29240:824-1531(-)